MGDSPLSPTNISSEVGTRKRPLPPSNDDQFGELAREVIFEAQGLWQYLEMHMPSTPSRSIKTAYRRDKPPYWYTNALHHLVNVTKLACGISLTRSLTIPKYISAFFGEGMYSKPFQSQLGILLGITIEPGCTLKNIKWVIPLDLAITSDRSEVYQTALVMQEVLSVFENDYDIDQIAQGFWSFNSIPHRILKNSDSTCLRSILHLRTPTDPLEVEYFKDIPLMTFLHVPPACDSPAEEKGFDAWWKANLIRTNKKPRVEIEVSAEEQEDSVRKGKDR